jgi:hypothetical protein
MTARELKSFIEDLEQNGYNLDAISINFRQDYDSEVLQVTQVEEDLYDEQTNSLLQSIVLVADSQEI